MFLDIMLMISQDFLLCSLVFFLLHHHHSVYCHPPIADPPQASLGDDYGREPNEKICVTDLIRRTAGSCGNEEGGCPKQGKGSDAQTLYQIFPVRLEILTIGLADPKEFD